MWSSGLTVGVVGLVGVVGVVGAVGAPGVSGVEGVSPMSGSDEEGSSEEGSELEGSEDEGWEDEDSSSLGVLLVSDEEGMVEAVGLEGGAFAQETAVTTNKTASKTAVSFFKISPPF